MFARYVFIQILNNKFKLYKIFYFKNNIFNKSPRKFELSSYGDIFFNI